MFAAQDWNDYELIDAGGGEKLERWGNIVLRRPDPLAMWPLAEENEAWRKPHAHYHRSSSGGGQWEIKIPHPDKWSIAYRHLRFYIKPTGFKHTGLFPEQAINWQWLMEKIGSAGRPVRVLNLFAYTGGATLACASAGAEVCHVDASKGVVQWCKENAELSGLRDKPIRYITDDVFKFVMREKKRGKTYDGIIMDPPSYGRGPNGETWKLEEDLYPFVETCMSILTDKPLFFLINSYTTGLSPTVLSNIMAMTLRRKYGGTITSGEIGLPITASGMTMPAGILGRWEA